MAEVQAPRSTAEVRPSHTCLEAADAAGLEVAFDEHGGELFGFAVKSLGDRSLAEDAVQETFVRAWRARARYDPSIGTLRSWLFAIERNVVIDLARARVRRQASSAPLNDAPVLEDGLDRSIESGQVQAAIARLSPAHRHVLVDLYYRHRSAEEEAAELGIPQGTVRSRLFYALRSLRQELEELGWHSEG